MATITFTVEPVVAERFAREDETKRRYYELQLQLKLYELLFGKDPRSFRELSEEMGRQAERNGLTPEILDQILKSDDES